MAEPTHEELTSAAELDHELVLLSEDAHTLDEMGVRTRALLAAKLAEHREQLALDPAFILPAAAALLNEAAQSELMIQFRTGVVVLDCFWSGRVTAGPANGREKASLYVAYQKLVEAVKRANPPRNGT